MDPQSFLDNFATIAEAPGGVQRLRELVLELAVCGRLVEQDPADEPGAALLDRVEAAHADTIASNGWRVVRTAVPVREDEKPWPIPDEWAWVRLEQLALPQAGFAFKSNHFNQSGRGTPLIRIRDIGSKTTKCHYEGDYRSEFLVEPGDYLVGMDGNFNIRRWAGPTALLNQRVTRLIFFGDEIQRPFVAWALQDRINALNGSRAYTTVQHLSGKQIAAAAIPVPPLAEQERIVAKVDDLMELCDELESRQEHRHRATTRFRGSALHALTEAETPEDLRTSWERVSTHWPALTDHPDNIPALRQTVLQLAVHGRLVAQDPLDEPAESLLNRLTERRGLPGVPLPPTDRPCLPSGWAWASFGQTTLNRDSERIPLKRDDRADRQGDYDYYGASGVIDRINDHIFDGDLLLIGEDGANLVLRSTPIAFIASGQFWVNNHAHVLDSIELAALQYLAIFVNSINLKPYLTGIAQPKLNQARMNRIPVPVPPLPEQRRIVKRVEQLLGVCDALEQALADRRARQVDLAFAACRVVVA